MRALRIAKPGNVGRAGNFHRAMQHGAACGLHRRSPSLLLARGKVRMERVSSDQQNFEKLLKERIVLYPQEVNVGYAALRSQFTPAERARITHHPKPLLVNQSYLMLPKRLADSEALMQRFNQRLQAFRDSGRYDRYFHDLQAGKYMLTEEEATQASAE